MTFSLAIVSNIAFTTLKLLNKVGGKIQGNGFLVFKQATQPNFELEKTFILHCGNDLLTDLYKRSLIFQESFPKNGRKAKLTF